VTVLGDGPGANRVLLDFGREMSERLQIRLLSGSVPGILVVAYSESLAYLTTGCNDPWTGLPPDLGLERSPPVV
jgi:hypothetical protein